MQQFVVDVESMVRELVSARGGAGGGARGGAEDSPPQYEELQEEEPPRYTEAVLQISSAQAGTSSQTHHIIVRDQSQT